VVAHVSVTQTALKCCTPFGAHQIAATTIARRTTLAATMSCQQNEICVLVTVVAAVAVALNNYNLCKSQQLCKGGATQGASNVGKAGYTKLNSK